MFNFTYKNLLIKFFFFGKIKRKVKILLIDKNQQILTNVSVIRKLQFFVANFI